MKKLILVACFLVVTLAACGTSGTTGTSTSPTQAPPSPTATPKPTATPHAQAWTTVQKFSGNGSKKTQIFSVPGDYKILWSCEEVNIGGYTSDGTLDVTVYGTDNSYIDNLFETCKVGSKATTGESEEHQGGQIYLAIEGSSPWSIQVQVLK